MTEKEASELLEKTINAIKNGTATFTYVNSGKKTENEPELTKEETIEWLAFHIECYGEIDFYLPERQLFIGRAYEDEPDENGDLVVKHAYVASKGISLFEGTIDELLTNWLYDGVHSIKESIMDGTLTQKNFELT